jgi:hypothetical protein
MGVEPTTSALRKRFLIRNCLIKLLLADDARCNLSGQITTALDRIPQDSRNTVDPRNDEYDFVLRRRTTRQ